MKTIIETQRFLLREFIPEDAGNMFALNADWEVIRYTGDKAYANSEEALRTILNYTQYRDFGCGRWSVIGKTNKDYYGWCGLKYSPEKKEHDIGFRFFKKYWNQGIASETAEACIIYGFNKLGLKSIVGRVMKQNLASVKVLQKTGLVYEIDFDFEGQEGMIFRINNPNTKA